MSTPRPVAPAIRAPDPLEYDPDPDETLHIGEPWFDGNRDGFAGSPLNPPTDSTAARELYLDGYAVGDRARNYQREAETETGFAPADSDDIPF